MTGEAYAALTAGSGSWKHWWAPPASITGLWESTVDCRRFNLTFMHKRICVCSAEPSGVVSYAEQEADADVSCYQDRYSAQLQDGRRSLVTWHPGNV